MLIPHGQVRWWRSAWASRKARGRVLVGPRTVWRSRGEVSGGGTLAIGGQWPECAPMETHAVLRAGSRLVVEGAFRIMSGCQIGLGPGATLRLGSGYMNNEGRISCTHALSIGHGVAIGPRVSFLDDDRHDLEGSSRGAPITVGDHVWIGMNVLVLKGVTIGDGAVIAAGSVVTRDVPPGMLAAGVPAKVIRPAVWR